MSAQEVTKLETSPSCGPSGTASTVTAFVASGTVSVFFIKINFTFLGFLLTISHRKGSAFEWARYPYYRQQWFVFHGFWYFNFFLLFSYSSANLGFSGRSALASINFVTCHDGFNLVDLVSYDHKHNEANGENNNDGANDNHRYFFILLSCYHLVLTLLKAGITVMKERPMTRVSTSSDGDNVLIFLLLLCFHLVFPWCWVCIINLFNLSLLLILSKVVMSCPWPKVETITPTARTTSSLGSTGNSTLIQRTSLNSQEG